MDMQGRLMDSVNIFLLVIIYGSMVLKLRKAGKKQLIFIVLLSIVCIGLGAIRTYYENVLLSIISFSVLNLYFFCYNWILSGKKDWKIVWIGLVVLGVVMVNQYIENTYIRHGVNALFLILMLQRVNTILKKLAQKGKRYREKTGTAISENIPVYRKLLFGKTGKWNLGWLRKEKK